MGVVAALRGRACVSGNYVQLATVTPGGLPRNRTVVFRGWVTGADQSRGPELEASSAAGRRGD